MTLKDVRISYDYYSAKLSDIVRQLCFAGIAVVWIFRKGTSGISLDEGLTRALTLFVAALGFDLLHYVYSSAAWGIYAHRKEKEGHSDEDTVSPHDSINWFSLACFWIKSIGCILAYSLLLDFLNTQIHTGT